ncbi:hypothetical protein V3C99_018971 [Haemonchus contortus]|uniref:Sigma70_r4_2 domain-containing protein n=1 Tax=Haemonchus contortus TaxID=6289 RepID=A0A7I4YZ59_HAECO|nr:Hypothetical protein CBG04850 [Haemonchus contortus]
MSQKNRSWRKRYEVWPPLRMPEEGVFTESGYLFHHETPQKLDTTHRQRLLEYGIVIAHGDRFTVEEDGRIRKNWLKITQKYGFIYEDARIYVGYVGSLESVKEQRRQNDLLVKIAMWPQLCRKLEWRSAAQVQRRMMIIFDPYYIGGPSPLSQETVLRIHELALRGKTRYQIAESLSISKKRVDNAFTHRKQRIERLGWTAEDVARDPSMLERNCLPRDRYYRLFEVVVSKSSLSESKVADYLRSYPSDLKSIPAHFNWNELIPLFRPLQAHEIKHEWRSILKKLSKLYLAYLESFDENQAWACAKAEVMPERRFSISDLIHYTKALRKCTDKDANTLRSQFIDKGKLMKKLAAKGIVDVGSYNLNTCPLYRRISNFLRQRNSEVFRQLRFPLTARDMLRILEACYRRLISQTGDAASNPRTSLPKISMHLLIECIIDRMHKIDSSWQAPVIFQPWIRSWEHVMSFSKQSNNEEIGNSIVDRHRLRETLFENPKHCLYGSEPSSRELYSLWDENWTVSHAYSQNGASSSQGIHDEIDVGRSSDKQKRLNSTSTTSSDRSGADATMEPSVFEENTLQAPPPCLTPPTVEMSEELFESDQNRESPYNIFEDIADETILAGNVLTQNENVRSDGLVVSPSKPTSPPLQTTNLPTDIFDSPEPSPKRRGVHWEDEEDSFSILKISAPTRSVITKPLGHKNERDIEESYEGWMQFLA